MENPEDEEYYITDKHTLKMINICKNCNKQLNIPPIYCVEYPNGLAEICGRCYLLVRKHVGNKSRQQAYENIAQFLTYSCSYKYRGCNAILKWKDVLEHEAKCIYPIIPCPANGNDFFDGIYCAWEGSTQLMLSHISESHPKSFLSPPQFDELPAKSEMYFTNACDNIFMIVILKQDTNKYACCVLVRGGEMTAHSYRYQIELTNSSKTNSIILRRNKVEHWFNIESVLCNENSLLEIDCDVLGNLIGQNNDKKISIRFGIVKKSRKEIKQIYKQNGLNFTGLDIETIHKSTSAPDDKLLTELECPVCNEYMVPPIYICSNGHSLCNECLTKVQTCPNCRCSLGNTRNFTLENLTTKVLYNCRNKEAGCNFVTTSENIREHESYCTLTMVPCLFNCGQNFRIAHMWPHFTSKHQEAILESGEIHKRDINDKREGQFFFFTCGEIFRFSVRGCWNQNYKFNIQWFADIQEKPRFKYTLEIIDKSPYKLHITNVNLVLPINDTPMKNNAILIPWDMIKPFIVGNAKHFYFKYSISHIPVSTQ